MAEPGIPPGRFLSLTALVSAAPVAVLAVLAAAGEIAWRPALIGAAACVLGLAWLVRRTLDDIYRVARFAEQLARGGEGDLPTPAGRSTFPEIAVAIQKLRQAWARDSGRLGERASSAETILEGLPDPLILIGADRQIVRATVGARALLGPAAPGRDLSAILRNPDVLAGADRVLGGESAVENVEFDIQFPTEHALTAQIQRLPRVAADGSAAVVALFDVTAIKRVQQMRADFVANASHELRTPLSVLSGAIATLRGPARDDAEARAKFLAMMEDHTTRMTRLVDDLLSLSRIELNENTPPQGAQNVADILARVVASLEIPAAERGIEIVIEPAIDVPEVAGDGNELAHLFQNLIDNAIKYSREQALVRIDVARAGAPLPAPLNAEGRYVRIAVSDQGPGIAPEHIPRLTERFYRVDAARSREMGGTGLGLAIVKHIVGRHRGALTIESVEGEGSTFTVYLPADTAKATAASRTQSAA